MTRANHRARPRAPPALIWTALTAVYIIWGTTYLAIRVSNETLPPLIAAGFRFFVAGLVLYAVTVRRGDVEGDRPTRQNWIAAGIVGAGLVAGGNGLVVLAERTVPSGTISLIIALVPLWMALVDRVLLRHEVGWLTTIGLVMGFGGAALLIGGTAFDGHAPLSGLLGGIALFTQRAAPEASAGRSGHGDVDRWADPRRRRCCARRDGVDPVRGLLDGIPARAGLPHHDRVVGGLHLVRVASPERAHIARVDVRVREPGRRRVPRVAHPRRDDHAPNVHRRRDRRGRRRDHHLDGPTRASRGTDRA